MDLQSLLESLEERFGILAESDTNQLTVIARNVDVAVGDLFLLPSLRGGLERFYVFRTTQYANVLNRSLDMGDIARNKLTMEDSYLSEDLLEEQLIELKGIVLGYAQRNGRSWDFHRPRRLPEHLCEVYQVGTDPGSAEVVRTLLAGQLGGPEGLYVGDLLAGEDSLPQVPVYLPAFALSHHIGVFGRTGAGKSNLMMVLLNSVLDYNRRCQQQMEDDRPPPYPAASILAIDPHDEFRRWHAATGGRDGLQGMVQGMSEAERARLVAPFYYLTGREVDEQGQARGERRLRLSRADVMPRDIISIMEFSEPQQGYAQDQFGRFGETWIGSTLLGDMGTRDDGEAREGSEYLPGTVAAVGRRLDFLRRDNSRIFTPFDPDMGDEYESLLPDIVCALERGRVISVDTTLMGDAEQFLMTTVIARTLFSLRRALKSVERPDALPRAIRHSLGNDDDQGQIGLRTLADKMCARLERGELPYLQGEVLVSLDALPYVNVVVEEAPSILNPQRMRFGSVFRDISRQGRKFGIGLTVVSQQVSEIDKGVLTQINTELVMSLGNEVERREAVRNASVDLGGFEKELQVMGKGQVIISASYKDVPLPVQVPDFDRI